MGCPVRIMSNYAGVPTLMNPPRSCGIKLRPGRTKCIFHWHLEDPPLHPYSGKPLSLSGMQEIQAQGEELR